MNTYRASEDDVHTRAEYWFARLRAADCSAPERREFDSWQTAAPANAAAYMRTRQLWEDIAGLTDDPDIAQWRASAHLASRRPRRYSAWRIAIGAAAALFFGVVGTRYFVSPTMQGSQRIYQTARGEQSRLTLEDGSHLTLNTDTRLGVRIDARSREVELIRGEAMFEVAHENMRPFRVKVGGTVITDLGTSFNVRSEADYTQVTLIEGRAQIERDSGKQTAELSPGDQLTAGVALWKKQTVANLAPITNWTSGRLVFHATPLRDVVAQVNRYGPGHLVIGDSSIESLEITGDFRIGNTQSLVRALQSAFPVRVQADVTTGETRLYRRK